MTSSEYTHLALLIDRSGSMIDMVSDMEPAIRQMLAEQAQQPGKLLIDVTTFDTVVERRYTAVEYAAIRSQPLIVPRGLTALLDAIGQSIHSLGGRLAELPEDERPGHVVMVVVTDGEENASREYSLDQVRRMIETQQSTYSWTFSFLGANLDAVSVGASLGVPAASSMTYDSGGVTASFNSVSAALSTVRGGGDFAYSTQDRENATVAKPSRWRKKKN